MMVDPVSNPTMKRLSVLDFCPYWTWPVTGGGPERIHNLNKVLSEYVNVTQLSVRPTIGHQKGNLHNWVGSRSYQHSAHYLEKQYFSFLVLAACYFLYKNGKHSDIYLSNLLEIFGSNSNKTLIEKSDIVQVEHPWLFDYAKRHSKGRPIVFVAHNVESNLWDLPSGKNLWTKLFTRSSQSLEESAIKNADALVCMSAQDADFFVRKYGVDRRKVEIIPNGANFREVGEITAARKLAAKRKLNLDGKFVILFVGSDHYPNKEALRKIQEWQAKVGKDLNAVFVVIGTVGRNAQSAENLRIEGFVDSAQDYFLAADIALNPLLSGSGTSLKIVDYLRYQLPTVTTEIGIRGLALRDNFDVLVSDIECFPDNISKLFHNPALMNALGRNGFETVRKLYSWEDLGKQMVSVYQKVRP